MKIFNLDNAPKGQPAAKTECIVIATWEEWQEIVKAIDDRVAANPRGKKLKKIQETINDHLAVY